MDKITRSFARLKGKHDGIHDGIIIILKLRNQLTKISLKRSADATADKNAREATRPLERERGAILTILSIMIRKD
jgi:hypothetical protein